MSEEIKGNYTKNKEALLSAFDQTVAMMGASLTTHYGAEFGGILQREALRKYEKLIPEIPYIRGDIRTRMLNYFLLITAQELAVYKALKKHGKSPAAVFELCDEALRLKLAKVQSWKRSLIGGIMFSGFAKKMFSRRARKNQVNRFGNFTVEYVGKQGQDFDYGINDSYKALLARPSLIIAYCLISQNLPLAKMPLRIVPS